MADAASTSSSAPKSKRRRCISDAKESEALSRSEQKFLAKDLEADLDQLRKQVREQPNLMITIKAAVVARLKAVSGERLYRGNRTIGT
eukprot:1301991-Lingulodinium_polyedra.AAC.1